MDIDSTLWGKGAVHSDVCGLSMQEQMCTNGRRLKRVIENKNFYETECSPYFQFPSPLSNFAPNLKSGLIRPLLRTCALEELHGPCCLGITSNL